MMLVSNDTSPTPPEVAYKRSNRYVLTNIQYRYQYQRRSVLVSWNSTTITLIHTMILHQYLILLHQSHWRRPWWLCCCLGKKQCYRCPRVPISMSRNGSRGPPNQSLYVKFEKKAIMEFYSACKAPTGKKPRRWGKEAMLAEDYDDDKFSSSRDGP